MNPPLIYRAIPVPAEFEFRTNANGTRGFTGYAAVFNSDSEPMPFIETIQPNAFARSLKSERDNTFVVDHDDTKLLGSRRARTVSIVEDSKGLLVDQPELPRTSYANDLIELHDRGEARHMSFTFRVTKGGELWSADNKRRTLTDVKLGHVAVLTGLPPAYRQTSASIRSLAHSIDAEADLLAEAIEDLRDGRPLDPAACLLVGRAMNTLIPDDRRWSSAADDAASATYALSSLLYLLGRETDDPGQFDQLKAAVAALQSFIAAETAEIGTEADMVMSRSVPTSIREWQIALAEKAS